MADQRFKDWGAKTSFTYLDRIPIWDQAGDLDRYIEIQKLIRALPVYDPLIIYSQDDFIVYGNKIYFSLQGSNQGNTPTLYPYHWQEFNASISGINQNCIINGFMQIAQRGTSFITVGSGDYTLDRWQYIRNGSMRHDISQVVDRPASEQLTYSMKIDCTTASGSLAVSNYCYLGHKIEGYDFRSFWNKNITLKFWVKATATGIYCVSFRNNASNRSYVAEYTINSSDTWEEKNITITHDTTGTWLENNSVGLNLCFALAAGSNYHGTADTWQAGNYIATSNQIDATASTSNDFVITGVQLSNSAEALSYSPRDYAHELSLCQRYYIRYGDSAFQLPIGGGGAITTTNFQLVVFFPTDMRDRPTFTPGTVDALRINTSVGTSVSTAIASVIINKQSANLSGTFSGLTAGDGGIGYINSGKYIEFDAEL